MQVIICKEKHGEYLWDASTPEARNASALAILTDRYNQGYWYYSPDELLPNKGEPPLSTEEIEALPEPYRSDAKRKLRSYDRQKREYDEYAKWFNAMEKAVKDQDPRGAWSLLEYRGDHEYEEVSLETVHTAEGVAAE